MEVLTKFRLSMSKPVRIGIIGGGQLGKMIAQEAKKMSFDIIILDPTKDCPASSLADEQIVADFANRDAIMRLAENSDVITYEIELANADALRELEERGYKVAPSSYTLKIIQDKLLQREVLKANNLPVPEFEAVSSREDLIKALDKLGYPAVLKARRGSYDGRGNFIINSREDIDSAVKFMNSKPSFLEEFVNFSKEVSIMVARNFNDQVASFPLVENIHKDSILHLTIAPARVDDNIKEEARKVAEDTMRILKSAGIFGIEMFVDDKILINEIAPRPHNSGHYTIEACDISQFEMHLRAILNLPLPKPRLLTPAVMINILGDENVNGEYAIEGIDDIFSIDGVTLHIYGKKSAKKGRKLGHITATDVSIEEAIRKAEYARSLLKLISI